MKKFLGSKHDYVNKDTFYLDILGEKIDRAILRELDIYKIAFPGKVIEEIVPAPEREFKDWDDRIVFVDKTNEDIELKFDGESEEYGTLAIEVSCGGKDSGMETTKCTTWLQVGLDAENKLVKYFKFSIEELRKAVITYRAPLRSMGRNKKVVGHSLSMGKVQHHVIHAVDYKTYQELTDKWKLRIK